MRVMMPGSFDPLTFGHAEIVRRAADMYEEVVVAVLENPGKAPWFTATERQELASVALADLPNVRVDRFDGLLVQFARTIEAKVLIKGLRCGADFEYERMMAQMNRTLEPSVETVFLAADPRFAHISSTLVREVAWFGGAIEELVPANVAIALQTKVDERKRGRHHR